MRKVMFLVVVALVLAGGALKYSDWKDTEQKRAHAVQQMRDPESVQFRNERIAGDGWLCGEMNGKNDYGAYTGFTRFLSRNSEDVWAEGHGYIGAKREGKDAYQLAMEVSDAKAEFVRLVKLGNKTIGAEDAEPPSASQIEAGAARRLFLNKWEKHCT